ncbi:MAG: HAD family hydrolase [Anaerolineae bacterium]|jgi:beta-phosphoglucomutase family hydrolase
MSASGVLWDMDGVLVDTGEFHFRAWRDVLADYDIAFTHDFHRETFGMNNAGILSRILGTKLTPQLQSEISDRKEEQFRAAVRDHAKPLPGVRIWLERLQSDGFRQAIASSAPMANIDTLIGELELRPFFDAIVSGTDLPGKPNPAVFLRAAETLGVPAESCIVVEDAIAGVQAARQAGMKCIAVTTTNGAEALAAADMVVDRLDALPSDAFRRLVPA